MKLDSTKKYIYENCAARISLKIKDKKLSYRSIYKSDPRIIGKICRCDIDETRNPYLIQDCVRDELLNKLDFNSYQDILWGTLEERTDQFRTLFLLLITDLVDSSSPYKNQINNILCGYTPYARYVGYYKIIFEQDSIVPNVSNADLYDVNPREMLFTIDHYFSCAVNYLYDKCKHEFINLYNNFANEHESFKRWTYRFEEWISDELIPMLSGFTPSDNSLGIRILHIIESDYNKIPLLYISADPDDLLLIHDLLSASEKYISSLEQIQLSHSYIEI